MMQKNDSFFNNFRSFIRSIFFKKFHVVTKTHKRKINPNNFTRGKTLR